MRILRFLPVLLILAPSAAFGAPAPKVTICHWANGNAHSITISANALSGHFDGETGKPVPGHESDTLGECPIPTPEVINDPIGPDVPDSPIQPEVPVRPELPMPVDTDQPGTGGTQCGEFVTSYAKCPEAAIPGPSAPTGPSGPELPRTGLPAGELAIYGIAAILAGLALWGLGRPGGRILPIRAGREEPPATP
jgi:hypothetical protein